MTSSSDDGTENVHRENNVDTTKNTAINKFETEKSVTGTITSGGLLFEPFVKKVKTNSNTIDPLYLNTVEHLLVNSDGEEYTREELESLSGRDKAHYLLDFFHTDMFTELYLEANPNTEYIVKQVEPVIAVTVDMDRFENPLLGTITGAFSKNDNTYFSFVLDSLFEAIVEKKEVDFYYEREQELKVTVSGPADSYDITLQRNAPTTIPCDYEITSKLTADTEYNLVTESEYVGWMKVPVKNITHVTDQAYELQTNIINCQWTLEEPIVHNASHSTVRFFNQFGEEKDGEIGVDYAYIRPVTVYSEPNIRTIKSNSGLWELAVDEPHNIKSSSEDADDKAKQEIIEEQSTESHHGLKEILSDLFF